MRAYTQPSWASLTLSERAKLVARQGHQFATSLEVRVVHPLPEDALPSTERALADVPRDGKTVGEIVTRGNITMKEVSNPLCEVLSICVHADAFNSIFATRRRRRKRFVEVISAPAT
jgi:hypothetical protein